MLESVCNSEIRRSDLSGVSRYASFPMLYPQDLNMHHFSTYSVANHLKFELEKSDLPKINWDTLKILCYIHDDSELFTVDFPSNIKMGLSQAQQQKLTQYEESTFNLLLNQYGVDFQFDYVKYLKLANEKKTIESQVMSYSDKICGFSEMIHETLVGNYSLNTQGSVKDNYNKIFTGLPEKLPLLTPFFTSNSPHNFTNTKILEITIEQISDLMEQKIQITPTPTSIQKNTGIKIYDFYVDAMRKHDSEYAANILTNTSRKRQLQYTEEFYFEKLKEYDVI